MLYDKILNVHALEKYDDIVKDQLLFMYNQLLSDIENYGYNETMNHIVQTLVYYDLLMTKDQVRVYKRDSTIDNILEEEEK